MFTCSHVAYWNISIACNKQSFFLFSFFPLFLFFRPFLWVYLLVVFYTYFRRVLFFTWAYFNCTVSTFFSYHFLYSAWKKRERIRCRSVLIHKYSCCCWFFLLYFYVKGAKHSKQMLEHTFIIKTHTHTNKC